MIIQRATSFVRLRSVPFLIFGSAILMACSGDGSKPSSSNAGSAGAAHDEAGAGARADAEEGGAGGAPSPSGRAGTSSESAGRAGSGGPTSPAETTEACKAIAAEPLPGRLAIASDSGGPDSAEGPQVRVITKQALFDQFVDLGCGISGCHGGGNDPNAHSPAAFKLTLESFDQRADLGTIALQRIRTADELKVMPPGSGDGSKRTAENPLVRLGERLLKWQELNFPAEFEELIQAPTEDPMSGDPYQMSAELAGRLTNLGSCVPSATLAAALDEDLLSELEQKDLLFASLTKSEDLPLTIDETDLVSLSSAELARRRVFSYAPTYPLFSDNAGKMRHVRVPVGEIIRYDAATKDFDIPDNTRFYKTFLKSVKDKDGKLGYRKMETRLIVVRRDEKLPSGAYRTRSLRATYAWDKEERMARRVTDPLRDGTPAADRLCPYVTDESMTRDPALNPISDEISEYCEYMTQEELENPSSGAIRHYGIPSTERCDQCHMGSNNHSYVLGFTPWQVDRRQVGEGGVFEPSPEHPLSEDELSQLQRFIDYGIVSGIAPGEAKLEDSQGERKPRNDYELKAQAYMLGNCAFCHTPNGFPVIQNPVLKNFDLFPSETGGVFQFSLERYSPRAKAGQEQAIPYPYITPAFGDYDLIPRSRGEIEPKVLGASADPPPVLHVPTHAPRACDNLTCPEDYDPEASTLTLVGPWRSLIWRNVYTPFTYTENNAIFVHMPRNAAGYDCRAHKIMAEWMLSIPAVEKENSQNLPQPVREVTAGEDAYKSAAYFAKNRLKEFAKSLSGAHCPNDDDIVDPKVILSRRDPPFNRKNRQVPKDDGYFNGPNARAESFAKIPLFDVVPEHAHWVPTDTTNPPGRWRPRVANWKEILATRALPPSSDTLGRVIDELQDVHLTPELEKFATEPLPMGLWHERCTTRDEVKSSPLVSELKSRAPEAPQRWLTGQVVYQRPRPDDSARVHFQSRGESVFRQICQNCHGREADSKSPLAATILELTGGSTRVANFIDGLFGPSSAPGAYARGEFLVDLGATPEEWQVRYLLFMGLGGTQAELPTDVLHLVATAPFYGSSVTVVSTGTGDANMLNSASAVCGRVLGAERKLDSFTLPGSSPPRSIGIPVLAGPWPNGGYYELWESLCTLNNEPVVQVFLPSDKEVPYTLTTGRTESGAYRARDAAGNWIYPVDHPVGTQLGEIQLGIQPGNTLPWCIKAETDAERELALRTTRLWGLPDERAPLCPAELLAQALLHRVNKLALYNGGDIDFDEPLGNQEFAERFLRRGAMNAGIAAYYYLRGLTQHTLKPSLPFDFCTE